MTSQATLIFKTLQLCEQTPTFHNVDLRGLVPRMPDWMVKPFTKRCLMELTEEERAGVKAKFAEMEIAQKGPA